MSEERLHFLGKPVYEWHGPQLDAFESGRTIDHASGEASDFYVAGRAAYSRLARLANRGDGVAEWRPLTPPAPPRDSCPPAGAD